MSGVINGSGVEAARQLKSRLAAITMKRLGLRYISTDELTIRRKRIGDSFTFVSARGRTIRDELTRARLKRLAVPPAYEEVLYAADPRAHIQAIGRDAAGRLQYRYHADWEKVRERRKAKRLQRLVEAMPRVRRAVNKHLAARGADARVRTRRRDRARRLQCDPAGQRELPQGERHARRHDVAQVERRGARRAHRAEIPRQGRQAHREGFPLSARRKRDQRAERAFRESVCSSIAAEDGVRIVTASDVNAFLREIAGVKISLKDFRTLSASAAALEALAHVEPASSERGRKRQVKEAVTAVSEELVEHADDLPQELRAPDRGGGLRERQAGEVLRDAEAPPLARASRAVAGAGRGQHGGVNSRTSLVMPREGGAPSKHRLRD